MAKNIKMDTRKDFRGGLNLRADAFELAPNESPDMLNVDIDPRGGVEQRQGISLIPAAWANPNLLTNDQSTALVATPSGANISTSNCTIARDTSAGAWPPTSGAPQASIAISVTAAGQAFYTVTVPVTPNTTYAAHWKLRQKTGTAVPCIFRIDWYTAASAFISSSATTTFTPTSSFFTPTGQNASNLVAPATAAKAVVIMFIGNGTTNPAAGAVVQYHAMHFAKGQNIYRWWDQTQLQLPEDIRQLGSYKSDDGVSNHLIAIDDAGFIWYANNVYNTAPSWNALAVHSADCRMVQFKNLLFFSETYAGIATVNCKTWDGTTLATLGQAFNDNLAAPTNANMPGHKFNAVFQGCMWIASTYESSVEYKSRVRWSHPNNPRDYRTFDYIDIDIGVGGDSITALVPFQDRLLVFKNNAVYAITGTSPDTFQVYPISRTVGAVGPKSIVVTDHGVYFYDPTHGVFLYDGKSISWKFERLYPMLTEGNVWTGRGAGFAILAWSGRRLWLSLPWSATTSTSPTYNTRTYVMDPTLTKEGSWVAYDFGCQLMYLHKLTGQPDRLFGCADGNYDPAGGKGRYYILEDATAAAQPYDIKQAGTVHITSYYVTPWFDAGNPVLKKRWLRPEFIARSLNSNSIITVDTRTDWDSRIAKRTFILTTSVDQAAMIWGDPWGEVWAGGDATSPRSEHHKGPSLGQSRAMQLKISGPTVENKHWGLNALTMKFTIKPPRS